VPLYRAVLNQYHENKATARAKVPYAECYVDKLTSLAWNHLSPWSLHARLTTCWCRQLSRKLNQIKFRHVQITGENFPESEAVFVKFAHADGKVCAEGARERQEEREQERERGREGARERERERWRERQSERWGEREKAREIERE